MHELIIGVGVFACLFGAAMVALWLYPRLPDASRDARTHEVVKLSVGMVVVMSSLVLGLMTASLKKSFDDVDAEIHRLGTQLLVLNRTLQAYGPDADQARALLRDYTQRVLQATWPTDGARPVLNDEAAANLLGELDEAIQTLHPTGARAVRIANQAGAQLRALFAQHWTIAGQSSGEVSRPFLIILVFWLMLCFASFGYNAPRNRVVFVTVFLSASSIAAAIFLIVDLDTPFDGMIEVSSAPIAQALSHMGQ